MGPARTVFDLRLELDLESISGALGVRGESERTFSGYTGLIAALESFRVERAGAGEARHSQTTAAEAKA
jgi:hypothetical protein